MQGVEFVNDLCCNYLTLPYEGKEDDFALRMLIENMTEVFLPLELRRLDGQTYLYYNISGMQNMEIIYAEKTIDKKAFREFMWNLHEAIEQSRELFLPGDGICLEPSALFWNLGTQRWAFIYIPKRDDREMTMIQSEREQLAEFLVMRIDYEDKKLTDTAYRFYEEICAGRMYTEFFQEREAEENEREWEDRQNRETAVEEDGLRECQDIKTVESEEAENCKEAKKAFTCGGIWGMLLTLWCVMAAAVFLLGNTVQNMALPGGIVISLLTVLMLYIRIREKRIRNVDNSENIVFTETEAAYVPYEEDCSGKEVIIEQEKTVYIDIVQEQERKLYGIGKFRQQKIFLNKLPCTIGKDKTLVNHIISDTSVSRIHARFFSEGETLWMQDLNSTNGTFHNGLRLRPNEKIMLETEDEIGFGRAQFVFR